MIFLYIIIICDFRLYMKRGSILDLRRISENVGSALIDVYVVVFINVIYGWNDKCAIN